MKDIIEILSEVGIEVPEDKRKEVLAGVAESYRTIADYTKQREKLAASEEAAKAKEAELADMADKLKALDASDAKVAELQKQLADMEAKEAERKAEAEKKAEADAFEPKFAEALNGREFANGIVAESVKAQAFAKAQANPDMPLKSIIEGITKDADGVFVNPQQPTPKAPVPDGGGAAPAISTLEDVRKLSTEQINQNWDAVQRVLSRN